MRRFQMGLITLGISLALEMLSVAALGQSRTLNGVAASTPSDAWAVDNSASGLTSPEPPKLYSTFLGWADAGAPVTSWVTPKIASTTVKLMEFFLLRMCPP
jgi:hypothetical protein